jgi:histidinol-phosphate aminotransferase
MARSGAERERDDLPGLLEEKEAAAGRPADSAAGEAPRNFSRRRFAQLLGAGMAGAGSLGPLGRLAAAGQRGAAMGLTSQAAQAVPAPPSTMTPGAAAGAPAAGPQGAAGSAMVRLSANENPYGPSALALDAIRGSLGLSCRYPDEPVELLRDEIARQHGVDRQQVLLGAGSSEILKLCALAFTGAAQPLVAAQPTFEALSTYARRQGAATIAVPLTADFQHDLPRMLAAAPAAALFYLCNPNNPTASFTSRGAVRAFLTSLPSRSVALVDEAYFHYVDDEDYESVVQLIEEHANLIVTRTFSKIYGMAGLRCGYAVARREVIARLAEQQAFDSLNILAVAAARASLIDSDQIVHGRRINRETRTSVCADLDRLGYRYIPSVANFLMIDLRRPVGPVIRALKQRRVEVGRVFPALPNHLRVTVGTPEQMQAFAAAFRDTMAAPAG